MHRLDPYPYAESRGHDIRYMYPFLDDVLSIITALSQKVQTEHLGTKDYPVNCSVTCQIPQTTKRLSQLVLAIYDSSFEETNRLT
jgi:hypothetical protein